MTMRSNEEMIMTTTDTIFFLYQQKKGEMDSPVKVHLQQFDSNII